MPLGQWWKRAVAVTDKQKRNIIIGLSIAAAVGVVLWLVSGNDGYDERAAAADSREVQESLEIARSIAQAPDNFLSYMVDEPNERAKVSVEDAALQMNKASSIELKDAAWFGDYMRVEVVCEMSGGRPLTGHFFFVKQRGKLRITGADK